MIMPLPVTPIQSAPDPAHALSIVDRWDCSLLAQEGAFIYTWILQQTLVVALCCAPCLPGDFCSLLSYISLPHQHALWLLWSM